MYKLLIFILLPFFAFSNDLNLESVCSSPDQDSVTEKFEGILCESGLEGEECRDTLRTNYNSYIEAGWTRKQVNYISYYISKDKPPNRNMPHIILSPDFYRSNWMGAPLLQEELLNRINDYRRRYDFPQLESISTTTPGCENLFQTENQRFNARYTCNPDQESVTRNLLDRACRHTTLTVKTSPPIELTNRNTPCAQIFMRAQGTLIENGWTQQQLNYIGHYVTLNKSERRYYSSRTIPYTEYILEQNSQPPNKEELRGFINNIRAHYNRSDKISDSDLRFETSDCEFPFPSEPDESTTEAGAECAECNTHQENQQSTTLSTMEQMESLMEQMESLQEQIESLQNEANNEQPTTNNEEQQTTVNNEQPTTNNDEQPTVNDEQPTTNNNEQPTVNNEQPTVNNEQPTVNNEQPTVNDEQPTTNR